MNRTNATLIILALCVIAGWRVIYVKLGGPESFARLRHFNTLVKTCDRDQLLSAAIPIIEASTDLVVYTSQYSERFPLTNLPPIIATMRPNYVVVEPDHMELEFHGGFEHFGFRITKLDQQWALERYNGRSSHDMLRVPISEHGMANQTTDGTP
jgi:hypothetical protein